MLSARDADMAQLATRIAAGDLSAVDLISDCLSAIDTHASLGAMLRIDPAAMIEARGCDEDLQGGRLRGALHGVPIVVKDNIDVVGLPTTSGNRAMARAMPLREATQVTRLRAAGAVIIGKSNLSEFSFETRSRSSLGGDVRNPFLKTVTSGGSSGGTAVAVAMGFAIGGLGTDTGGSIRVPAAYTGLVGLRPTHDILDMRGVAPLAPSTDTIGPVGRSVGDVRFLFEILSGHQLPLPSNRPRVGLLRQAFGSDPEIGAAIERVCAILVSSQVPIVDEVRLAEEVLPIEKPHIVDVEFARAFDEYLTRNFEPGTAPSSLRAIVEAGAYLPEYRDVLLRRCADPGKDRDSILRYHYRLRAALSALMEEYALDVILYPTSMTIPKSLDSPKGGWAPELAACSGWPALSVPAGRSAAGVPIGVEMLGRAQSEPVLFAVGEIIGRGIGPRAVPALS